MSAKFQFLLLLSILRAAESYDFIFDMLQNINQSSNPCDNFFRHACPIGSFNVHDRYKEIVEKFKIERGLTVWQNLDITKALERAQNVLVPETPTEAISQFIQNRCESGSATFKVLQKLEEMYYGKKLSQCLSTNCLTALSTDKNCTRMAIFVTEWMNERNFFENMTTAYHIERMKGLHSGALDDIDGISLLMSRKLLGGLKNIQNFIARMILTLNEWVKETPWVANYNLTDFTLTLASVIHNYDNYGEVLEKRYSELMTTETDFKKCIQELGIESEEFCILYLSKFVEENSPTFFNFFQAFNEHPRLAFGLPLIDVALNSVPAAQLGYTGVVTGHEIAHTLIENPKKRQYFPMYSAEAIQCVQDQYNATCQEFKEVFCVVGDMHIDENGSDVLGIQLAYKLFEDLYGNKVKKEYLKLNKLSITFQQLFFYSFAFTFCNGSPVSPYPRDVHAARNVRINSVANHPAFQDAFQCSNDSRMMKTVEKQCIIFGKDAPAQR